jgi:Domain of unknown function (DUF4115)
MGVPKTRFERLLAAGGALLILLLVGATVVAWQDYRDSSRAQARSSAPALTQSSPETRGDVARRLRPVNPAKPRARAPTAQRLALTAARGDCWLQIRSEDESGDVLYEGVLLQGKTLELSGKKLWLRMGAPDTLEAKLNGRTVEDFPAGTSTALAAGGRLRVVSVG